MVAGQLHLLYLAFALTDAPCYVLRNELMVDYKQA
jgi:hypothetical protein